jgi:hypothetical protein
MNTAKDVRHYAAHKITNNILSGLLSLLKNENNGMKITE